MTGMRERAWTRTALAEVTLFNLYTIQATIAEYLPKIFWAAVILVVGFYLGRLLRKITTDVLKRSSADTGVTFLLGQMVYWTIAGISVILAVGRFVDVTALVASLGLVAFALTFALQDVLKNFAAGIILLVQRPFIVGDYVQVSTYEGTIKAVNSRSTGILTPDGLTVLLPNATVLDNPIVNYTRTPQRRIEIRFSLPYEADLPHIRGLALDAVKGVPDFLPEPAPDVIFEDAIGGVTLKVRLWVDTLRTPTSSSEDRALDLVYHALKAEGVEFRYPRQEVAVYMNPE
jgi:small conductance mechanosensitive channel